MNGELDENIEDMATPEAVNSFASAGRQENDLEDSRRYSESTVDGPPKDHLIAWDDPTSRRKTETDISHVPDEKSSSKNMLPPVGGKAAAPTKPSRSMERQPSIVASKTEQPQEKKSLQSFSNHSNKELMRRYSLEQKISVSKHPQKVPSNHSKEISKRQSNENNLARTVAEPVAIQPSVSSSLKKDSQPSVSSSLKKEESQVKQEDDLSVESFTDTSDEIVVGRFPLEEKLRIIEQPPKAPVSQSKEMGTTLAMVSPEPCDHPIHKEEANQRGSDKNVAQPVSQQPSGFQAYTSASKFSIQEEQDPQAFHNDTVITFDDVYSLPPDDSTSDLVGLWRAARKSYDVCHWCCHLTAVGVCAVPSALCFGCWFAWLSSRRVWCYAALGKACNLAVYAKCWGACVYACCAPFVEVFGACVNKIKEKEVFE